MSIYNVTSPENIMTWCEIRLNSEAASKIIRANPAGLSDKTAVESALKAQNYIKVLTAVWGERDRGERLAWLQTKSLEAVLPYELALAEFKSCPSVETLTTKTLPLFAVASARSRMDIECSSDNSIGSCGIQMKNTYEQAMSMLLREAVKTNSDLTWPLSKEDEIKQLANSIEKLVELKESIPTLSSPKWVEWCGMQSFMRSFGDNVQGTMRPSENWATLRRTSVESYIQALQARLNTLNS